MALIKWRELETIKKKCSTLSNELSSHKEANRKYQTALELINHYLALEDSENSAKLRKILNLI